MNKIRVALISNSPSLRCGIRALLDTSSIEIVEESCGLEQAFALHPESPPEVVLLDALDCKPDAAKMAAQAKLAWPEAVIVAIAVNKTDEQIQTLLEVGVAGFVDMTVNGEQLARAIQAVRRGELVLDACTGQRLLARNMHASTSVGNTKAVDVLTEREMSLLKMVAGGMKNQEIARELSLSDRTVKACLTGLFAKFGVDSRTEAVLLCLKAGWLTLDDVHLKVEIPSSAIRVRQPNPSVSGDFPVVTLAGTATHEPQVSSAGCSIGQILRGSALRAGSSNWRQNKLEKSPEGRFVIQNERYVFADHSMATMFGYSPQELIGTPFVQLVPEPMRETALQLHRARIAGNGIPSHYLMQMIRKDGARFLVIWQVLVMRYRSQPAVVGVACDAIENTVGESGFRSAVMMPSR